MNPTKETIVSLVIEAATNNTPPDRAAVVDKITSDTVLFGPGGLLDSLALVNVVLDIEEGIRSRCDVRVTLADDRAMSQTRSPFRRVSSLADYALLLITEAKTI